MHIANTAACVSLFHSLVRKVFNRETANAAFPCDSISTVVSDSVQPHRRQPTRLLHPWDSLGKNTGVGLVKAKLSKIYKEVHET